MKKSIVATLISGGLIVATVVTACGQPAGPGAAPAGPPTAQEFLDFRTAPERQLEEVWRQMTAAVQLGNTANAAQLAEMYTALEEAIDVQRTLAGIDEAQGMLMATMEHQGATTDEFDAALIAIENARQEVLARMGPGY